MQAVKELYFPFSSKLFFMSEYNSLLSFYPFLAILVMYSLPQLILWQRENVVLGMGERNVMR